MLKSLDLIIVGAGSVVANILTENTHWKALLIEAGGDEISYVPALAAYLQLGRMDWQSMLRTHNNTRTKGAPSHGGR